MRLTAADRKRAVRTASRFIQTAVARKQLDSAWGMLGPEMRAGQTRKSWDTGFNNVCRSRRTGSPRWDILYAYKGDVAIDLGVVGAKDSDWAARRSRSS